MILLFLRQARKQRQAQDAAGTILRMNQPSGRPAVAPSGGREMQRNIVEARPDTRLVQAAHHSITAAPVGCEDVIDMAVVDAPVRDRGS